MKFSVAKSLPGSAPGGGPKVVSATSLSLARARHRIGVRGPGRVNLRGLGRGRGWRRLGRARACSKGATRLPGPQDLALSPAADTHQVRGAEAPHPALLAGTEGRLSAGDGQDRTAGRGAAPPGGRLQAPPTLLAAHTCPDRSAALTCSEGEVWPPLSTPPIHPVPGTPASPTAARAVPRRVRAAAFLAGPR